MGELDEDMACQELVELGGAERRASGLDRSLPRVDGSLDRLKRRHGVVEILPRRGLLLHQRLCFAFTRFASACARSAVPCARSPLARATSA